MLAVEDADGVSVAKATGMSSAAAYLAKSRVLAKLRKAIADFEEE